MSQLALEYREILRAQSRSMLENMNHQHMTTKTYKETEQTISGVTFFGLNPSIFARPDVFGDSDEPPIATMYQAEKAGTSVECEISPMENRKGESAKEDVN
ncbi:705_t:CDS:1 [Acaulospora colombiana]|uniref:705_t:CDS:1 n=1 Tax=Acaulospora colombiana TaxID=27376 RepID=A0ACA9LPT7_9GLOM|nr:705_t:CDS:1 [Acaulospora colombiana]